MIANKKGENMIKLDYKRNIYCQFSKHEIDLLKELILMQIETTRNGIKAFEQTGFDVDFPTYKFYTSMIRDYGDILDELADKGEQI